MELNEWYCNAFVIFVIFVVLYHLATRYLWRIEN